MTNLQRLHLYTPDESKAATKIGRKKYRFPALEAVEKAGRGTLVLWHKFLRLPKCRDEWRVIQRIMGRLFETYPA